MKKEKGITLIALIITIVIMLIIAGISINIGKESLYAAELRGFYTQLEVIQKRIDDIATTNESYIDSSGNTIYLKEQGTAYGNLTSSQKTKLQNIISDEGSGLGLSASSFRYFTVQQLENILGLSEIDYNVFVDFDSRTVIAEQGITVNEKTYHILNNTMYFVKQGDSKNDGEVSSLKFTIVTYGKDYYTSRTNYYTRIGNSVTGNTNGNTTGNTTGNTVNNNTSNTGNNNAGNTVGNTTGNIGNNNIAIINPPTYYGEDNYKIIVTPYNGVNEVITGGTLKYKKSTSNYWETANGLEFVISELTKYDVVYEDNEKNTVSVTINTWLNANDVPMVTIV